MSNKIGLFGLSFFISFSLLVGVPGLAQTHVLSGVAQIFAAKNSEAAQTAAAYNSQNLPLLQAARNVDPNPSKGGGDITVVSGALAAASGPSGTMANIETHKPDATQISIHVVREGETLSQIADLYGVTTNTVVWANDIGRGESIQPGQQLVILPISGVRHEVEEGETLRSIAKEYDGSLTEIVQYNDIDADASLKVGQVVVIPDGEVSHTAPATPSAAPQPSGGTTVAQSSGGGQSYYIRPVSGGVRTQGIHGYNSVDLADSAGTPIVAAASGKVIISRDYGWNGGYGHYVVIQHNNGSQTLYAHNSRNIVRAGDSVKQGQVIAYMGSTGKSTGTHVHFEIRGGIRNPF